MKSVLLPVLALVAFAVGACSSSGAAISPSDPQVSTPPAATSSSTSNGSVADAAQPTALDAPDASAPAQPAKDGGAMAARSSGCGASTGSGPGTSNVSLTFAGVSRTATLHVPSAYDRAVATPLVIDIHGYLGNPSQQEALDSMDLKAEKEGFIVVYPAGLDSSWNAGMCCGQSLSSGVDDVGFIGALLDQLESQLCIDTTRVYATGMSNGGFLSHRLGCEMADRIAAIAPVAGVMGLSACAPSRPVPVLHFHGTSDPVVPYGGIAGGYPSVAESIAGWIARDGCTDAVTQTYQKGDATCTTHAHCNGGAEVTLCTIDGGGHTWPGGQPFPLLGKMSTDISATDQIWSFFQRFSL